MKSHPGIIRRMVAEGHEIGNHTDTHPNLAKMSDEGVRRELNACANAIFNVAGVRPRTFRPPFGSILERQRTWIYQEYGYPTILWNVDPLDWKYRDSGRVARELIAGARPGGILLAHDIHKTTVSAMPDTLDRLLERGYRFVTVTQLLSLEHRASMAAQRETLKELGSGDFFGGLLARRRVLESVRYKPDLSGFVGS